MFELANLVFKKKNRAKKDKVEQKYEFDNQIKKDSMHISDQSTIESPEIDFKKEIGEKRSKVEPKNEFDNQNEQHSIQLRNKKIVKNTKHKQICSDCGASYVYKSGLQSHMKRKHSKKIYPEYFYLEGNLNNHIESKHLKIKKERIRKFKCSNCDATFLTRDHQEYHMNGIHLNLAPYKCDHCQKCFKTALSLKAHVNQVIV